MNPPLIITVNDFFSLPALLPAIAKNKAYGRALHILARVCYGLAFHFILLCAREVDPPSLVLY